MKTIIAPANALLMMAALSCSQPALDVTPTSTISGSGGSSTPTPPGSTILPALLANPNPINDLWIMLSFRLVSGSSLSTNFSKAFFLCGPALWWGFVMKKGQWIRWPSPVLFNGTVSSQKKNYITISYEISYHLGLICNRVFRKR